MKTSLYFLLSIIMLSFFSCNSKEYLEESIDNASASENVTTRSFQNVLDGPSVIFVGDTVEYIFIYAKELYWETWVESDFSILKKIREYKRNYYGLDTYVSQHVVQPINGEYTNISMKLMDKVDNTAVVKEKSIKVYRNKPTIVEPDILCDCDNSVTFRLKDLPSEVTNIMWYSNIGNIISGQGTSEVTFSVNNTDQNLFIKAYVGIEGIEIIHDQGIDYGIYTERKIYRGNPVIERKTRSANLFISDRSQEAYISADVHRAENINWNLISGNATIREGNSGVFVKSLISGSSLETIKVSASATNHCGTTTETYAIEVAKIDNIYKPINTLASNPKAYKGGGGKNNYIEIDLKDYSATGLARFKTLVVKRFWIRDNGFITTTTEKIGDNATSVSSFIYRLKFVVPTADVGTSLTLRLYIQDNGIDQYMTKYEINYY